MSIHILFKHYTFVLIIIYALGLYSCANVSTPSGGPKDETPPELIKTIPENGNMNFNSNRLFFDFNEFIQLKSPDEQILISPPLSSKPIYKIKGKSLTLIFTDTLNPKTTYSINFGQSIVDLNEGNPINNLNYVFSTGNEIDSSSVSGIVKDVWTGKPLENIAVFLYKSMEDSIVFLEKPFYVGYTDVSGNFIVKNLKPGEYKMIALEDLSRNYLYEPKSEKIGFLNDPVWVSENVTGIEFNLFNSLPEKYKINAINQPSPTRVLIELNKPIKNKDSIHIDPVLFYTLNPGLDTITIWSKPEITDSINFTIYTKDSVLFHRQISIKKQFDSTRFFLEAVRLSVNRYLSMDTAIKIRSNSPLIEVMTGGITILKDSTKQIPIQYYIINEDKMSVSIKADFEENHDYFIQIKEKTLFDVYNKTNKPLSEKTSWPNDETFGSITLMPILKRKSNYILELNDEKGKLIRKFYLKNAVDKISIKRLQPGKYTIRIIEDINDNKIWDTGSYIDKIFPEPVYNVPNDIEVRANWDTELTVEIP
jgi:Bacterial Ig-like domain